MSAPQTAQGFFDDLLTMEVNVILKDGMTARKMPASLEAFHDIAEQYEEYLDQAHDRIELPEVDEGNPPGGKQPKYVPGLESRRKLWGDGLDDKGKGGVLSAETFVALAERVDAVESDLADYGDDHDDKGQPVVLKRIKRNSQVLALIIPAPTELGTDPWRPLSDFGKDETDPNSLQRRWKKLSGKASGAGPTGNFTKEDWVTLRKAWEVGTETVVMQTVAQVDGDIVTRIQKGHAEPEHAPIHDIHRHLVGESLQHWRFLFATVASFTLGVFKGFFKGGG